MYYISNNESAFCTQACIASTYHGTYARMADETYDGNNLVPWATVSLTADVDHNGRRLLLTNV